MKNRIKASAIIFLAFSLLAGGCSNNKQNQESQVSKSQMRSYYYKEFDLKTKILSKYADSLEHNQNLVKPDVKKLVDYNKDLNRKLKANSINTKASKTFIKYNNASINWANCISDYLKGKPNKINKYSKDISKYNSKLSKEINISENYTNNAAKKALKKEKDVIASLPQVKGKTAITNDSKITITGSQMIPGYNGEKTLLIYYTATNLTDDPIEGYKLLIETGSFEQDNGNSYSRLNYGSPSVEWEEQHSDINDMSNQAVENKLKSKATGNCVTFLRLANDQSPVLYQVKDPETRQKLGTIKIPLNEANK